MTALPCSEVVVLDAVTDRPIGAGNGAWRCLGYSVVENGRLIRVHAETFGLLPLCARHSPGLADGKDAP